MQRQNILLAGLLLLTGTAVFVTGNFYVDNEDVLIDNHCKCVKVTSKFVPSMENPEEEILERYIEITVPLKSRTNISDPYSPLRTSFEYNFADLCKKCDPLEIEIGGVILPATQGNCGKVDDTCYTYNRLKCYTTDVPFTVNGETIMKKAALNPESCWE